MLRYGIPQYRLPKVEVLEAEYQAVWDLGVKLVTNAELGRDFTVSDLQNQGFDAVCVAIGCYDTNKLGIPGEDAEGVIDGLEYLRIATLGLPYPGHAGTRVVVVGGGFTSMDCSRTSVRQGATEVTLVYRRDMKDMPAANEVHEMIEEGARAIFQAAPTRVVTDAAEQGHGRWSSSAWRPAHRTPPVVGDRRPSPARSSSSTATASCWPSARVPTCAGLEPGCGGRHGQQAASARRGRGDLRHGTAGRLRHGRRAHGCGHRGGRGRGGTPSGSYAMDAYLKGQDLEAIRTRQTLAEPQPEFLSIVPYTSEVKEPRLRLKAMPAEERNKSYIEYEIPYTQQEAMARIGSLPAVHLRGHRLLRPAPPGHRVRHHAAHAGAGTHRACSVRSVSENRFTGINHDYLRDDSHAFILREPSRCIDCGRCANVCKEVVGAACYDFMRTGFDTLVTTPLDMSLNTTPCVSCGRCAETCPTGALMPKPRVLEKYEVDESALHPVRHLRRCLPVRRAALRARLRARPRVAARSR